MNRLAVIILALTLTSSIIYADVLVDVVYPRPTETDSISVISKVDSNFVLGSVSPPDSPVFINGIPADVYPNGAFFAFVPLNNDRMTIEIIAGEKDDFVVIDVPYKFPEIVKPTTFEFQLPANLKIVEKNSVIRYSGNYGVYHYFPTKNAKVKADSIDGNFFRLRLSENKYGWIEDRFVAPDTEPVRMAVKRVFSLEVVDTNDYTEITVPCRNYPVHQVMEHPETSCLSLYLYGVESHLDIIKYKSDYVKEIRWEQVEPDILLLKIFLNDPIIQGYDAEIDRFGNFKFKIYNRGNITTLKNLKICIDPGHGGESYGAIGASRTAEKDINLKIALKTASLLEKKGAKVLLTREVDSPVDLYERIDMGHEWGANLFISIHANAIGDGKNPRDYSGFGVYYYHPKSLNFAKEIFDELMEINDFPVDGFFYDNLAVPRAAYFPSILIETAYIIKPDEEMMLVDEEFQDKIAKAIYKGIKRYAEYLKKQYDEYKEKY